MKYIDADRLKAKIKERIEELDEQIVDLSDSKAALRSQELLRVLDLIDSLTQEQSDKESLNESQQEFANIVTERMLKEGPIPTLKGKQKAEFEKEFNRFKQIAGMVNWPAYEEIYKKIILWFMAWGADNLPNLNKVTDPDELDFQQEQLPGIEEHGIPGKDFIPVEWVDACEKYGKWKIVQQEQLPIPDNLKLNMTRAKLDLNEIETLTHLVRARAVGSGPFQGLYKNILSKLNKMFDEEYADRERKEEKK